MTTVISGNGNLDYSQQKDDLIIYGGAGHDTIKGGSGNNYIDGNGGDDILTGGGGYDTFVLYTSGGIATITDFTPEKDSLIIKNPPNGKSYNIGAAINFTEFTTHPLTIGSIQASEYPNLMYDSGSGVLSYNNHQIASLPAHLDWNPNDPTIGVTLSRPQSFL